MRRSNLAGLLFSPKGRIPRSTYWYYFLAVFLCMIFLQVVQVLLYFVARSISTDQTFLYNFFWFLALVSLYLLFFIAPVFFAITTIFIIIKRFHDFGWSGWYIFLLLIPVINTWPLLMLGFKPSSGSERKRDTVQRKPTDKSPDKKEVAGSQLNLP
jgi:uncharacterized membrane protein YhaH (DUF805 family)